MLQVPEIKQSYGKRVCIPRGGNVDASQRVSGGKMLDVQLKILAFGGQKLRGGGGGGI